MINEENSLGALTRTYVMDDPGAIVAAILADVSGTNPATGRARYYTHDNLGSTRGGGSTGGPGSGSLCRTVRDRHDAYSSM